MNPVKRGARLAICIAGAAGIALLALQLALLWAVSDGWSGIRASLPLLGAGALLSALACALGGGTNILDAAALGNLSSSITIAKLGETGTASREELCQAFAARGEHFS